MKKMYEKHKYEIVHFLVEIYPIVVMVIPTGLLINCLSNLISMKKDNINYYTHYYTFGIFIVSLLLYITIIILLWYKYYKIFKPIKDLVNQKEEKNKFIDINISDIALKYKKTCIKINLLLIFIILTLFLIYKPEKINEIKIYLFLVSSIFSPLVFYLVFNNIFYRILIFLSVLFIIISLIIFINKELYIIFYFILFSGIPIFEYIFINNFQIPSEENLEEKFK